MTDIETQERFVFLRAEGWSFARIAADLNISKPTLINWSRKYQFEIQNQRAIRLEALREKWLASRDIRVNALGEQLKKVQAELARRDVAEISTARLYTLADSLSRQIEREIGPMKFTTPVSDISRDEYHEQVQDWTP